ncbi:MAG: hypothetical protein QOI00_1209, partial [Chloroflexota bacterium]|nr:hypothetical protein [Chloroflexota bacterium]
MFFDGGFGVFFLISAALSVGVTVGLIALILLGIRWLIRNSERKPGGPTGDDTALAL